MNALLMETSKKINTKAELKRRSNSVKFGDDRQISTKISVSYITKIVKQYSNLPDICVAGGDKYENAGLRKKCLKEQNKFISLTIAVS